MHRLSTKTLNIIQYNLRAGALCTEPMYWRNNTMNNITTGKTIAEIISATTEQLTEKGYNKDYCNGMHIFNRGGAVPFALYPMEA